MGIQEIEATVAEVCVVQGKWLIPKCVPVGCHHIDSVHFIRDVIKDNIFMEAIDIAQHQVDFHATLEAFSFKKNSRIV